LSRLASGALPIIIKQIFLCDEPYFLNILYAMLKPFLSVKIKKRVNMIGKNYSQLIEDLGGLEYTPVFIEGGLRKCEELPNIEEAVILAKKAFPNIN